MTQYALVVGVAQYDNFRKLDKAAIDAEAIAQLLEQHRYDVTRLPRKLVAEDQWAIDSTKKLTAVELENELKIFLNERATRQPAVIYFAGHGFRVKDNLSGEQNGYLATSDSVQNGQHTIRMDALNTLIRKSDLSSLVILLDCCHAGTLIEQRSLLQPTQTIIGQKQNYCLLAACRDFERAREGEQHGIFTAAVLQGLSAENEHAVDGEITSNSLFEFVARKMRGSGQEVVQQTGSSTLISLVTLPSRKEKLQRLQQQAEISPERNQKGRVFLPKKDIDRFTGRTKELKQLESQLLNVNGEKIGNIVGISGGGGLGKSTLAFHFAILHKDKFPDGVIGLPVDGKTVREVARDFARLGGRDIEEDEDLSPIAIMQEVFAHRRMLLIFDNVDNADLKVLQPGGQCSLIITTRDRSIHGSFSIPKEAIIDLPVFPDDDARKLLRAIVGNRVDDEPQAVDRILEMTDNLPLALEIVGCTLQQESELSLSRYAEYLKEEEDRLEELKHGDDIGLNVTASLEVSLKFLEAPDIDLFACLSVCAKDGFSLETAIKAGGLLSHTQSRRRLQKLHRFSLLNSVGEERYVFHTLVRIYAQARAQERNLWDASTKRHAEYFLNFVQTRDVENPEIAKQIIENFEDVLQAAQWLRIHAISDDLKESAYRFALDLRPFLLKYSYSKQAIELMTGFQVWAEQLNDWYTSVRFKIQHAKYLAIEGNLPEAEVILENAQDSIERISDPTQQKETKAKQLSSLGGILEKRYKLDEAIAVFQQQIEIESILNDQRSLAIALNRRGSLWQKKGKFEAAIIDFQRSIEIAKNFDDQVSEAIALNKLGLLFEGQEKHKEAIEVLNREISICAKLDDQKRLAITLNRLGGLLRKPDSLDLEEAISVFKREIHIDRDLGDQKQLLIGLNCIGRALQQKGDFDEAIATFKEQIEVAKALNDQKQVAIGWSCLGNVYQKQKNFDEAISAFQHEIHIEETLDNQQQLVFAYNQLGEVLRRKGDLDAAIITFKRGISLAESLEDSKKHLAVGLHCLGKALEAKGDWEAMIVAFLRSIFISETLNDKGQSIIGYTFLERALQRQNDKKGLIANLKNKLFNSQDLNEKKQLLIILNRLGKIFQNQNNFEDAIFTFQNSVAIAENLNDQEILAVSLNRLGRLLQQQHKFEEAINVFKREIHIDRDLGDQKQLLIGLNCIGRALQQKGDFDEAIATFKEQIEVAKTLNDQKHVAIGWNCLGNVYHKNQNFKESIYAFQREIHIEDALDNQHQVVFAYNCLGKVFKDHEDLEGAVDAFNQSIKIGEELNDEKINRAISLDCLGSVLRQQGKFEDAAIAFKEEITIAKELSSIRQSAIGWNNLGKVSKDQGYLEETIFAFLNAATYNESLEDNGQLHSIWKRLGDILRNKDNVEAANAALRRFNLLIVNDLKTSLHKSIAQHTLGKAYNTINRLNEAEIILHESQEWLDETNNYKQLLKVLKTLVETFEKKQDWKQAEQILHLSYNETEKIKDIAIQEKIIRKLGEICIKQETEEKLIYAKSCFRHSIKLGLEMNDPIRLAQAYKAWGDALINIGKLEDSVSVLVEGFEKLISEVEKQGQKRSKYIGGLRMVTKVLGHTLISLRRREEALEYCDRASLAAGSHDTWTSLRNGFLNAPKKREGK